MIALLGVQPPDSAVVVSRQITHLPDSTYWSHYDAFAVGCLDYFEVEQTLAWYAQMRRARPGVPLLLVADPADCAKVLAKTDSITGIIPPAELVGHRLPSSAFEELCQASIQGGLWREVVAVLEPAAAEQKETLQAVIARAAKGGSIQRSANDLNLAPATVHRRFRKLELAAGRFASAIRVRSYQLRIANGASPRDALRACGWSHQEARRKAMRRLGKPHDGSGWVVLASLEER